MVLHFLPQVTRDKADMHPGHNQKTWRSVYEPG